MVRDAGIRCWNCMGRIYERERKRLVKAGKVERSRYCSDYCMEQRRERKAREGVVYE